MKLYRNIKSWSEHKISILGITIYKKYCINNIEKKKFLGGILSKKTTPEYIKYYFCGIKVTCKHSTQQQINILKGLIREIILSSEMTNAIKKQHEMVFTQFKNRHKNQSVVLVATGPTLLHYKQAENIHHIAVNNAYKKIQPTYWFAIDGQNICKNYLEIQQTNFIKFFGQCATNSPLHIYRSYDKETLYHIPDCIIENSVNSYKFYFDHPSLNVNRDITTQALPDLGSCVFSAMFFAIWAGFKKIYVVGCDCSANGYFDGTKQKEGWLNGKVTNNLLRGWNIFKEYVEIFHPDVEIISVNPVGLRGMFRDVYTQSYLNANPSIRKELGNNIEILDNNTEIE